MIYCFVILVLLVGLTYDNHQNIKGARLFWFFEWLVLFLLVGIRYKIGSDTIGYYDYYDLMPELNDIDFRDMLAADYQPLWYLLCGLCKSVSPDFVVLQLVLSFVVNTSVFYFIKKYAKKPFLVVLLYFITFTYFNYNTEILRQSVTNSLFLLSIPFLLKKDYSRYYLINIIGIGFHFAGVFTLIVPVIYNNLKSKSFTKIAFLVVIGLFFISQLTVVQDFFQILNVASVTNRMEFYEIKVATINGIIYGFLTSIFVPLLFLVYCKTDDNTSMSFLALYVFVSAIGMSLPYAYRFVDMFSILFYIAIINYKSDLKRNAYLFKRNIAISKLLYTFVICLVLISAYQWITDDVSSLDINNAKNRYEFFIPYNSVFDTI